MDARHRRWENRSAEHWLEETGRFEKRDGRFDRESYLNASFAALPRDARRATETSSPAHEVVNNCDWRRMFSSPATPVSSCDADYYRWRAASERKAADDADDRRVRRVHLEMAERYQALVHAGAGARVDLAS